MTKKKVLAHMLIAIIALLLVACGKSSSSSQTDTSTSPKSHSKPTTSSSKLDKDTTLPFFITFAGVLTDGRKVNYTVSDEKEAYTIESEDGTKIIKDLDGTSYIITYSSGLNVDYFASNDHYVVKNFESSISENGEGRDALNKYLSENGYTTLDDHDKSMRDLLVFIAKSEEEGTTNNSPFSEVTTFSANVGLSDGREIAYNHEILAGKSYMIDRDGKNEATKKDGFYTLTDPSGITVSYYDDTAPEEFKEVYLVTDGTSTLEEGHGEEALNKYLSKNGYLTIDHFDKMISDMLDNITKINFDKPLKEWLQ
ncbi:hypothetical protein [Streptococcus merionis]|uniref:hypothetical protein n=1 Tax=Streptococcus merionis TaxID=400065 RepID=UPI0026F091E4|nr:hypothetical protein [Streptococcus merionis]